MASYKPSFKFAGGPLAPGASKRPFKAKSVQKRGSWLIPYVQAKDLLMIRAQLHSIRNQVDHPSEKQTQYIKHNLVQLQRMVESILEDNQRSIAVQAYIKVKMGRYRNLTPKRVQQMDLLRSETAKMTTAQLRKAVRETRRRA